MINFLQDEKSCRDKERREKDKRKLRSTSPKFRSSHSEKYRKVNDRKYDKENHKSPLKSSVGHDQRTHKENGTEPKHSKTKSYSTNSSCKETKIGPISCTEGPKKKIKRALDNLFGEEQIMQKDVVETAEDLEEGEISEGEISK